MIGRGALLVLVGLLIGGALALLAAKAVSAFLFGITSTDPVAIFGSVLLLALAGLLASWIPARRALRIDPTLALRME